MDPERDRIDEQAPEAVPQNFPEPVQHTYHNNFQPNLEDGTGTHTSSSTPYSHYASPVNQNPTNGYHAGAVGAHPGEKSLSNGGAQHGRKNKKGLLCGCTTLVFVLSVIIAILAAAVVGLAVGTGVEANRAKSAEAKLSAAMSSKTSPSTVTVTATTASASASSTSFAALDDNCSGDPSTVNGTTYNSFSLIADQSFTIRCNADALGPPLYTLFTSDLNTCMDACASYTTHITTSFGNNTNSTCGGVSFIPLWANKTAALTGGAPGNCYLKPTQTGEPDSPNIGTECHAGILNKS